MPRSAKPKMQATLVRFGPELLAELRADAQRSGISVAQYIREAVVARLAYTAAQRGEPNWAAAYGGRASRARQQSRSVREDSRAVRAEGKQAARRSEQLRTPG